MHFRKRTIDDEATFELIENVCLRPRMYYPTANSIGDVLAFINGISCGMHPPHGCLGGIVELVWAKFQLRADVPWTTVVLNELIDLPYEDARESLANLFREYKSTLE